MTARQFFRAGLTELAKETTAPLLLEDFNHFINRAILLFTENVYHAYELNQKVSDDLRVLSGQCKLDVTKSAFYEEEMFNGLTGATYECKLPLDYMHMLGCQCIFRVEKQFECYDAGQYVRRTATRGTVDMMNTINEDYYNRPSYRKPYYIIKNVNESNDLPTQPVDAEDGNLTREFGGNDGGLPKTISINGGNVSLIEKPAVNRYGNASAIRMEIRYGHDDTLFKLEKVLVDYMRVPQHIRLTQKQLDLVEDTSQILEFPDITIQQILTRFVAIMLEHFVDQRLSTNVQLNNAIMNGVPDGITNQQATASPAQ